MPFGLLSQVCHTSCSSSSFLTAATVSFTPLRSFLPSFRSIHHVRSFALLQSRASFAIAQNLYTESRTGFSAACPTILTGLHYASLRHPFSSVSCSPPAAHNLACLAACHGYGFVMFFVAQHTFPFKTKTHAKPLRLTVAVYRRCTAF